MSALGLTADAAALVGFARDCMKTIVFRNT